MKPSPNRKGIVVPRARSRRIPLAQSFASKAALWAAVTCLPLASAFSAIVYWDGDGAGDVGGNAGIWDTTLLRWSPTQSPATYQAWNNANNDDAVFTGTGGVVSGAAGVPITVNSISINGSSGIYTLGKSTTEPIQLNAPASGILTINVDSGSANIINAQYSALITTIIKNGSNLLSTGVSQPASGNFAFHGKWVVNGGILSVPGDLRLGVLPTSVVPDLVTLNGGFLRCSTAATPPATFNANRGITLGPAGGGFDGSATNATVIWNGPITGISGGSFTKRGPTTNWVLNSNTSDYDGPTLIESGKLTAGAANALGSIVAGTQVSVGAELVFNGATSNFTTNEPLTISGTGTDISRGAVVVENGANITLGGTVTLAADATVSVAGDSTVNYSNPISFTTLLDRTLLLQGGALTTGGGGTIGGAISLGIGGLTKEGEGKWTLGGTSTYSGITMVNAGALIVNGSLTGTTQVDVIGTLGGNGTITPAIGGNVSIIGGGKLAPGASVGTLSFVLNGGQLDINSGVFGANSQALLFELATPSASDKVVLTGGSLSIGNGVLELDDFAFAMLPGFTTGDFVLFDGSAPINGTLGANLVGTLGGFDITLLLADGGKDIVLHVIPEPSAGTALLGGFATLLGLRRRRC